MHSHSIAALVAATSVMLWGCGKNDAPRVPEPQPELFDASPERGPLPAAAASTSPPEGYALPGGGTATSPPPPAAAPK